MASEMNETSQDLQNIPSWLGIAVDVRHTSISPRKRSASLSYCRPRDLTEMLKIVVVNEQSLGGL